MCRDPARSWRFFARVNAEAPVYLDSSALVKLVVREAESEALRYFLEQRGPAVSCALARVEVVRAVRKHGAPAVGRAGELLEAIRLLRLDDRLLDHAASLEGDSLRSLDSVHVAAALELDPAPAELVTYDAGMARAARGLGLIVSVPE